MAPETITAAANTNQYNVAQAASQLKPMLQMLNGSSNPAEMMKQLCMQNPSFKQAFEAASSIAGGDPKSAFFAAAKQRGVDPNAIISALSG